MSSKINDWRIELSNILNDVEDKVDSITIDLIEDLKEIDCFEIDDILDELSDEVAALNELVFDVEAQLDDKRDINHERFSNLVQGIIDGIEEGLIDVSGIIEDINKKIRNPRVPKGNIRDALYQHEKDHPEVVRAFESFGIDK